MSLRVCLGPTPGERCPTAAIIERGRPRCPACARTADKARGKRAHGSGTDWRHTKFRRDWQRRMDAGERVTCWRCGTQVDPTDWHLGHDDHDRSVYRGPEHPLCNLSAAGKARHRDGNQP